MTTMTDDLHLTMLASPAAAGLARSLIAQRLAKWGRQGVLDDVLLIASELIVNACEATPDVEIKFRLGCDTRGVFLAVWDSSLGVPEARPVEQLTPQKLDASAETWDSGGGWGLPIVQALSSSCGVQPDDQGGKWVWATRET